MSIYIRAIKKLKNEFEVAELKNQNYTDLQKFYATIIPAQDGKLNKEDIYRLIQVLLSFTNETNTKLFLSLWYLKEELSKYHLRVLKILKQANMLDFKNFEIMQQYPYNADTFLTQMLSKIYNAGMLNDEIFSLLIKQKDLNHIKKFLDDDVTFKAMYTQENLKNILLSNASLEYYYALRKLIKKNLYFPVNLAILKIYQHEPKKGLGMVLLKADALDSKENILLFETYIQKNPENHLDYVPNLVEGIKLASTFNLSETIKIKLLDNLSVELIEVLKQLDHIDDKIIDLAIKLDPIILKNIATILKNNFNNWQEYFSKILTSEYPKIISNAILILAGKNNEFSREIMPNLLSVNTINKLFTKEGKDFAMGIEVILLAKCYSEENVNKILNNESLSLEDQIIVEKFLFEFILDAQEADISDPDNFASLADIYILHDLPNTIDIIKDINFLVFCLINAKDFVFLDNILSASTQNFLKKFDIKSINSVEELDHFIFKYLEKFPQQTLDLCETYDANYLNKIKDVTLAKIINLGMHDVKINRVLEKNFGALTSIEFFDRGGSMDTWSKLTEALINKIGPTKPSHKLLINNIFKADYPSIIEPFDLHWYLKNGYKLLRLQGRTILLEDVDNNILAIKLQKKSENALELEKEYRAVRFLNNNKKNLKLKCYFPDAFGVFKIDHAKLSSWQDLQQQNNIDNLINMIGNRKTLHAYVYRVDKLHRDYFTYLHDTSLSDHDFKMASEKALKNLLLLLAQGLVFHQLADIFHNTEEKKRMDLGRFIVLSNLLSPFALQNNPRGLGRLTAWLKAVEYPNIRGTKAPLADLGDCIHTNDCMTDGYFTREYFLPAYFKVTDKIGNYILANFIAEYQYVFFLIAGRRGRELTRQAELAGKDTVDIYMIWKNLAEQLIENCALAVSLFAFQSRKDAKEYLLTFVNVDRLARQMQFFMTKEYISFIQKEKLPDDIYAPQTKIKINFKRFRYGTFNDNIGFSINGIDQDLGPVNGQEPIKEMNKLIYVMINQIVSSYHNFNLTLNGFKNVNKNSFLHLVGKQSHSAHIELDKLLLNSDKVSTETKVKIKADLLCHQREKAALSIQNFWRKNRMRQVDVNKDEQLNQTALVPDIAMA